MPAFAGNTDAALTKFIEAINASIPPLTDVTRAVTAFA
jgi:hypothetical protein